ISRIPGPYEREWRIVRPDGSMRWLLDRGETRGPVDPQTGLAAQVTGIIVDITERKLYEEKILMLMREVNHRAKNMLGLVQAMARQTAAATP
ncbi:HWE histidine kinase domain-containing protein, partial [Acinetobacter baumannii]